MQNSTNTPVIIGVGQSVDRIDSPHYARKSASDLAAAAATTALADAGVDGLAQRIGAIATTRTFEDSRPAPPTFGKSSNFPRSIANRLGIAPSHAVWEKGGGNSPQDLVSEYCERIAAGQFEVALICGGEAISTVRHAAREGVELNFREDPEGDVEDRGVGFEGFREKLAEQHGIVNAPIGYALAETARRARLGVSRADYAREMGHLFAPFAAVAHSNPNASWSVPAYSAEEIVAVTEPNRWISDPYPLRLVARDQVNLGAAIIIASRRVAGELGVDPRKHVYLHGYARATEKLLLSRPDLGASPAARAVATTALDRAGLTVDDIAAFDFYSCFPIAVSNVAIDELGLAADDPRKLTVTGGLPFFGGPGNNYSMHAIAEMVSTLRALPGRSGFVGANGGLLSKYSAGVYSTTPRPWRDWQSDALQATLNTTPDTETRGDFFGEGTIETYTVFHSKGKPQYAIALGRTQDGKRFIARSASEDVETATKAHLDDAIGRKINTFEAADGTAGFTFIT